MTLQPTSRHAPSIVRPTLATSGSLVALTFGATLFLVTRACCYILPVSYVATGSIIVADREPIVGSSSPAYAQKVGDPADMESTILLIRSPRLLRMLFADAGRGRGDRGRLHGGRGGS